MEVEGNILNHVDVLKKVEETLKILPNLKDKNIRIFQDIPFYGDGRVMVDILNPMVL